MAVHSSETREIVSYLQSVLVTSLLNSSCSLPSAPRGGGVGLVYAAFSMKGSRLACSSCCDLFYVGSPAADSRLEETGTAIVPLLVVQRVHHPV